MPNKKCKKEVLKVPQGGSQSGGMEPSLSTVQEEILHLLAEDFLTVRQVAMRRNTTVRAVHKVRQKLIEKGFLGVVPRRVLKTGGPSEHGENLGGRIRLHAEHFNIKIIMVDERYRSKVKKGVFQFSIDGNTVRCYRDSLDVYSNLSFFGETPGVADSRAMNYWTRFFTRLESELKLVLVKPRSQNIMRVRAEYADMNNELAGQALKEHEKVRVVGDDGKVWLVIDNSFSLKELETVHRTRSAADMAEVVQPFFNDLRGAGGNVLLPQATSELIFKIEQSIQALNKNVSEIALLQAQSIKKFDALVDLERGRLERPESVRGIEDLSLADYFG